MKQVLLVALQNGGHNPNFVQWLAEYWSESAVPARLTVLVSASFPEQHPDTVGVLAKLDSERIMLLPAPPQAGDSPSHSRWRSHLLALPPVRRRIAFRLQRWQEWKLSRQAAAELNAEHALFINLDFYQFAATWNPDYPCRFSGIFHNLFFHYPTMFRQRLSTKRRLEAALQEWSMRRFCANPQVDTIFCLDPYVVEYMRDRLGIRHAAPLPTPARITTGGPDPKELRRRHQIEPGRRIFLMLGGIGERRGIYQVLEALRLLEPDIARQLCLLVVGRQTQAGRLAHALELVRSTTHAQIITRNEFIPEEEIGAYYQLADIVLATHIHHVGVSVSLVQAAAAGKPVIASDFGLLGELTLRYRLGATVNTLEPASIAALLSEYLVKPLSALADEGCAREFAARNNLDGYSRTIRHRLSI